MDSYYSDTWFPQIGEVYLMRFDGKNSEQCGWRPGLVYQNNIGNKFSPNIIALPFTTAVKKINQPTHVLVFASDSGLYKDSIVLCENPERMSKNKVGRYLTTLSDSYMKKIAEASLLACGIVAYLDLDTLVSTWEKAVIINNVSA